MKPLWARLKRLALFVYSLVLAFLLMYTVIVTFASLVVFYAVTRDPLAFRVMGFDPSLELYLSIMYPVLAASMLLAALSFAPNRVFFEIADIMLLAMALLALASWALEPTTHARMALSTAFAIAMSMAGLRAYRSLNRLLNQETTTQQPCWTYWGVQGA